MSHCSKTALFFFALLLFLHLLPISTLGNIQTVTIASDSRDLIEFEKFGFTSKGHLSLSVTSISIITSQNSNLSKLGFINAPYWRDQSNDDDDSDDEPLYVGCYLDNPNFITIFNFSGIPLSPPPSLTLSKAIKISKPNEYILLFVNCLNETSVSMVVNIETYNLDDNGDKDYLSDGKTQLPTMYFSFSVCYIVFLVLWIFTCLRNKSSVKKIHILMGVLLVMKSLNLIFAGEEEYHLKTTGVARGWDILFYVFQFLRATLLFLVIFLAGTGWSVMKPFLQRNEKWVLLVGVPLQVFSNIAYIMLCEFEPYAKGAYGFDNLLFWMFGFVMVDVICSCLIFFSLGMSIRSLKEASTKDGSALVTLKKMRLFRDFYYVVGVYVILTKLVPLDMKAYLYMQYRFYWMGNTFIEIINLVFYVIMFYMFRPVENNQYFILAGNDDEEDKALATIQGQEFEEF